ncbi:hypothetical protein DOTSEDRAFT_71826 [Dothistroma septosporum NZE10]|uniref:Uncharacterized protein n=1 Tax=Dothistroma septosporum (strain NZE10 / CBS 128990) TaxID=675120 RepID=N1PLD8_DOTSN|nr:hypothetical protein DOTSEDRAFT_71826 [Dothistroma septosporum NZE10]
MNEYPSSPVSMHATPQHHNPNLGSRKRLACLLQADLLAFPDQVMHHPTVDHALWAHETVVATVILKAVVGFLAISHLQLVQMHETVLMGQLFLAHSDFHLPLVGIYLCLWLRWLLLVTALDSY